MDGVRRSTRFTRPGAPGWVSWLITAKRRVCETLMSSFWYGKRAPRNPWGGSSLEWQAPTPPPLYNFEKPVVVHELYNYDDLVEVEEDVWERRAHCPRRREAREDEDGGVDRAVLHVEILVRVRVDLGMVVAIEHVGDEQRREEQHLLGEEQPDS